VRGIDGSYLCRARQFEATGYPGWKAWTTDLDDFGGKFPRLSQRRARPELIERMQNQAAEFGAEFMEGHVTRADLSRRPW